MKRYSFAVFVWIIAAFGVFPGWVWGQEDEPILVPYSEQEGGPMFGYFESKTLENVSYIRDFLVQDLDGNEIPEIIFACPNDKEIVIIKDFTVHNTDNESLRFPLGNDKPYQVLAANIDNEGPLELIFTAVTNSSDNSSIKSVQILYFEELNLTIKKRVLIFDNKSQGSSPLKIEVGDTNNDGFTDILINPISTIQGQDGCAIYQLFNKSDNTFETIETEIDPLNTGSVTTEKMVLKDIDGDGINDLTLLLHDGYLNTTPSGDVTGIYIYKGNDNGHFDRSPIYENTEIEAPYNIGFMDTNNDDYLDLIIHNSPYPLTANLKLYLQTPNFKFTKSSSEYNIGTDSYCFGLCDINEDGKKEIYASQKELTNPSTIIIAKAEEGKFIDRTPFGPLNYQTGFIRPGKIQFADLNGDKWKDIILLEYFFRSNNKTWGWLLQETTIATPTEIPIPTNTPTPEPTETPIPTNTPTPEPTETPIPTNTPTPEPTETPIPTNTPTPEPTETPIPTNTPTPEPTETPIPTNTPTPEPTETPIPTNTPTPEPTETPIPTNTPTPEPTETPIPTDTPTSEPTKTPTPTDTPTPEPTKTPTPTNTPTLEPTETPIPTNTPTPEPTNTLIPTATNTRTPAPSTNTPIPTATNTLVPTLTSTPTPTPTKTPAPTGTRTPIPTLTDTPVPTWTPTPPPTATPAEFFDRYERIDIDVKADGLRDLAFVDGDGDGEDELFVISETTNELITIEYRPDRTLHVSQRFVEESFPRSIIPLTNESGAPLLLSLGLEPHVAIVDYSSNQALTLRSRYDLLDEPERSYLADYTGDGIPDIITVGDFAGLLSILPGVEGGGFGEERTIYLGSDTMDILITDLENDGRTEALVLGKTLAQITIYTIRDEGVLFPQKSRKAGQDPFMLTPGFYDEDEYLDFAVANAGKYGVNLFYSAGSPGLNRMKTIGVTAESSYIQLRDMDGDERGDLLIAQKSNNSVSIRLAKDFDTPIAFETVAKPHITRAGDMNADGIPDFAALGFTKTIVTVYLSRNGTAVSGWKIFERE